MDNRNIFDKKRLNGKKAVYYILMGLCVVIIAAAAFISYNSIQDAVNSKKPENKPEIIDPVDTTKDDVTDKTPQTNPETQPESEPKPTEPQSNDPAPETKGYIMPVENAEICVGFSTSEPVYSKTLNDWRIHDGVDLAADLGTNVLCVNDGAVEKIESNDLYGISVTVKHTDGKKSVYSNLEDSVELEEGQLINQGDIIGRVGESALYEISDGPHLHFEMSENGKKIDPMKIIKA